MFRKFQKNVMFALDVDVSLLACVCECVIAPNYYREHLATVPGMRFVLGFSSAP